MQSLRRALSCRVGAQANVIEIWVYKGIVLHTDLMVTGRHKECRAASLEPIKVNNMFYHAYMLAVV